MIGGEGDRIQLASGIGIGEGVLMWYDGERGVGDTSGIVSVLSGEGDRE